MERLFGIVTGVNIVFRVAVGHHLGEVSNELLGLAAVLALVMVFAPEETLKVGIVGSVAVLAAAGQTPVGAVTMTEMESVVWLVGGIATIAGLLRYPTLLFPAVVIGNVLLVLDGANALGVPPSEVANMLNTAGS